MFSEIGAHFEHMLKVSTSQAKKVVTTGAYIVKSVGIQKLFS